MRNPTNGLSPHLPQSAALSPLVFFHAFFSSFLAVLLTGLLVMIPFAGDERFRKPTFSSWNWTHEGKASSGASSTGFLFSASQ